MQAPTVELPPIPPPPAQGPAHPVMVSPPPPSGASPRAAYEAVRAKREVLGDYMSRLLNRRNNVAERLNSPNVSEAERAALEQHLKELNGRIIDMEKQLHAADAEVAAAAGVPGATRSEPQLGGFSGPSEDMMMLGILFTGFIAVILAIGFARRLWRGATTVVTHIPAALEARFTRFEQSLDAMAIEIERVSEGQRFLTKVFTEQNPRAIDAGPAQPIETRAEVAEPVRRS